MQLIRPKTASLSFEKLAARHLLSDNPDTHASELLAFLYKEHPYLGRYQVNLDIKQQDDTRGYLYGVFVVSPAADVPAPIGQQRLGEVASPPEQRPEETQTLRIPVIVQAKKAYGFDVFITPGGQFYPLSEPRVAAAMFDTNPFLLADPKAVEQSMTAGGQGSFGADIPGETFSGRSTPEAGLAKRASAESVFAKIKLSEAEVEGLVKRVTEDRVLRGALDENHYFAEAVRKAASAVPSMEKAASVQVIRTDTVDLLDNADAVSVQKVPGGYLTTATQSEGGKLTSFMVKNANAGFIPQEVRQEALSGQPVLLTTNTEPLLDIPEVEDLGAVSETGVYAVMNKYGSAKRAAVIADVRDFTGRKTESVIVVGPTGGAFQEKVAGVRVGAVDLSDNAIPGKDPAGWGFFLSNDGPDYFAYEPVFVKTKVANAVKGTTELFVEHPWLGEVSLVMDKLAQVPVAVHERKFLIPEGSLRFVPFLSTEKYGTEPDSMQKIASRADHAGLVCLEMTNSSPAVFQLTGAPVRNCPPLPVSACLSVLGTLGDSKQGAQEKIARARLGKQAKFVARQPFQVADSLGGETDLPRSPKALKKEARVAAEIRVDLVKEAAALPTTETVDSVLSLEFVTPENIQGYVNALPELEVAVTKLAELLVGVRLGLTDVPETAVASALRGLERAVTGLKKLQLREGAQAT